MARIAAAACPGRACPAGSRGQALLPPGLPRGAPGDTGRLGVGLGWPLRRVAGRAPRSPNGARPQGRRH
eukprot:7529048-Alexandrium_andersonii.AAC.1